MDCNNIEYGGYEVSKCCKYCKYLIVSINCEEIYYGNYLSRKRLHIIF